MSVVIKTENISYIYGEGTPFEIRALDDVSVNIESSKIVALIGHTGSGKSTLIQHLNALLKPDSGRVLFDNKDINESKKTAYDIKFKVGLCFQYPEYQLFESTVFEDIAFGPKNMKLPKEEIEKRVIRSCRFVGLGDQFLNKSPFDLSGGEKRRVAIAGIIAMEPEVLILDEPTAGLDPQGKEQIKRLIVDYAKKTGRTVIIVSHSMEDVAEIAEKIIVMNKAKVSMCGTVDEVFSRADELIAMSLNIPQVTYICNELRNQGYDIPAGIYTFDAAVAVLTKLGKGK
ncbi:MAG TPA: energy-coupling factor transporter ATPase [Clostridiales bacterium]|nr:energy-coupling factor transporter ATPase [Clostridiales bacterium]